MFHLTILLMSSIGGLGVHVQSDCGDRSSDNAQSLRHSWLGGQLSANLFFRIHEVSIDLSLTQFVSNRENTCTHSNWNTELTFSTDIFLLLSSVAELKFAQHLYPNDILKNIYLYVCIYLWVCVCAHTNSYTDTHINVHIYIKGNVLGCKLIYVMKVYW